MARCPKCGQESPEQARFCRFCGERMGAGTDAVAPDPTLTPEQRSQQLLEEAFRLSEQGRILAAIQTCQQALALNSNSTSAHSLLGTLYERQGDRDRAIREYEQVLTLSPESTVERRRLNELMGVPTAREPVSVSPRVARLAITGATGLLAVVAIIAVLLSRPQSAPEKRPANTNAAKAAVSIPSNSAMQDMSALPTPGRTLPGPSYSAPSFVAVSPTLSPPVEENTPAPAVSNTYIIPSSGAERYYARNGTTAPPAWSGAAPSSGGPVIRTGAWAASGSGWTAQSGRDYFLQGDYSRAAETYRSYLSRTPDAGGAPREELAWVYMQMGEQNLAKQEYRNALSNYQNDINSGQNVEAARHGLRTCQSAIRALEAR